MKGYKTAVWHSHAWKVCADHHVHLNKLSVITELKFNTQISRPMFIVWIQTEMANGGAMSEICKLAKCLIRNAGNWWELVWLCLIRLDRNWWKLVGISQTNLNISAKIPTIFPLFSHYIPTIFLLCSHYFPT